MLSGVEFDRDPMGATLDPAILTHVDPFLWPKTARNGHKWPFCGHTPPWRLPTGGSVWIKAGSGQGTSRAMCGDLFPGPEWPSGGTIGRQNGSKRP